MVEQIQFEPSDRDEGTEAGARRQLTQELLESGVAIETMMTASTAEATDYWLGFEESETYVYRPQDPKSALSVICDAIRFRKRDVK